MSQNIIRDSAARCRILQIVAGIGCAGVAQLAEHNVANVVVVGSNPITRSCIFPSGQPRVTVLFLRGVRGVRFAAGEAQGERRPTSFSSLPVFSINKIAIAV